MNIKPSNEAPNNMVTLLRKMLLYCCGRKFMSTAPWKFDDAVGDHCLKTKTSKEVSVCFDNNWLAWYARQVRVHSWLRARIHGTRVSIFAPTSQSCLSTNNRKKSPRKLSYQMNLQSDKSFAPQLLYVNPALYQRSQDLDQQGAGYSHACNRMRLYQHTARIVSKSCCLP